MGQEKATSGRPIDVTPAMIEAGLRQLDDAFTFGFEPGGDVSREEIIADVYRAMYVAGAEETGKLMAEIFGQ